MAAVSSLGPRATAGRAWRGSAWAARTMSFTLLRSGSTATFQRRSSG